MRARWRFLLLASFPLGPVVREVQLLHKVKVKVLRVRTSRSRAVALIIERGIYRGVSMRQAEHEHVLFRGCETLLDCQKIMVLMTILLSNRLRCIFRLLCRMQHYPAYLLLNKWRVIRDSLLFSRLLINCCGLLSLPLVDYRWVSLDYELIPGGCRGGRLTLTIANEG
jgi:hypothetical protein